ncbi:hypothetical protein P3S67_015625 [Capsicum chacoense]
MANNLTKCEFVAFQSSGKNYISWVLDAEIHLDAMGLGEVMKNENTTSTQNRAKAMIFLHHHLDEVLKIEYLTTKDPLVLWNSLKERFDHLKMVILSKARYEWMHLRFQDYKSIHECNSAMFRISSELKLCGETINDNDMIEKTLSTFHASNVLLQQQYREKGFKKYTELSSHLLVAEQINDLLMKNHENRPSGSTPFPEVNDVHAHHARRGKGHGPDRRRGRGRGRGRGHDDQERNPILGVNNSLNKKRKDKKCEVVTYFLCGGKGHYSRDCRALKHLVDLYQASLKKKERNSEASFLSENNVDITCLDVADFFKHPEGKINHLIGDGSINIKE